MLKDYDKEKFIIADLYIKKYEMYEQYKQKYDDFFEVFDEYDYGADEFSCTPEEYKKRLLGDLKEGERFILMKYRGQDETVKIPNGVTDINARAFSNNTKVRYVYIPDSVLGMGGNVFGDCTALEKVRLPNNLKLLTRETFYRCTSLKSVTIPDSVECIGINAFDGCEMLTDIKFGKNLKSIGWDAFARCTSLKSLRLPDALEEIDQDLFYNSSIEELYIPKSVKDISPSAFSGCSKLKKVEVDPKNKKYCSLDNCVYNKEMTEILLCRNDGKIINDGRLLSIEEDAFEKNDLIEEIDIPEGVESIGLASFRDCTNLKRVTLPKSLKRINRCAFERCSSLEEVIIPGSVETIEGLSFIKTGLKRVIIKRGVESINENAFAWCESLKELYIPSTVKNAHFPVGFKFECPKQNLHIYIEKSNEKNYENWIKSIDEFEFSFIENSEIFD